MGASHRRSAPGSDTAVRRRVPVIVVLLVLGAVGAVAAVLVAPSSAAHRHLAAGRSGDSDTASSTDPDSTGAGASDASGSATPSPPSPVPALSPNASADTALTSAMQTVLAGSSTTVSVGVTDLTAGVTATYDPDLRTDTASIVKVDILAALLLQAQSQGRVLTEAEEDEATTMIENSDDDTATQLWDEVGDVGGMDAGDAALGLTQTTPGAAGYWGMTTTSVADQLRFLDDLESSSSPLSEASRSYILDLMSQVETDQAWGVSAAADSGTTTAIKDGWFEHSDTGLWVVTSIGVVTSGGHTLLMAVLTDGQASVDAGEDQIEQVAQAAAQAVLNPG